MLAEISLNVVDIVRNSVKAGASLIEITIDINRAMHELKLSIADNGCGMTDEQLREADDPFFTSRKTRRVGLGIPFLKQEAEACGGSFGITSELGRGTEVHAVFRTDHIDCTPLGDINSSIYMLVTSKDTESKADIDYIYTYKVDDKSFTLDTREIREVMDGIPLYNNEVSAFIRAFLDENKREVDTDTEG